MGEEESLPEDESDDVTEVEIVEVDELELAVSRAEKAEAEIAYKDAEVQNVRKKMAQEKSNLIRYSGLNLSRRMLSVLSDVDRALSSIGDDDESPMAVGMKLIRKRLWQELSSDGVDIIKTTGEMFNPAIHEAISTIPETEEYPSGTIVEVLEEGYMYKDRLLQASKVVVSS